jgi:hypothetical protein
MIAWKTMAHDELVHELAQGLEERDKRVKALEALTGPRAGRPKGKNGFGAPEGDLDRESAGDA